MTEKGVGIILTVSSLESLLIEETIESNEITTNQIKLFLCKRGKPEQLGKKR